MVARLASGLQVSAWLRRLDHEGRSGYVLRRGDDTAGAILVKCVTPDGRAALWTQEWDFESDRRRWRRIAEGVEPELDAMIAHQVAVDPDLWLLEIETRDGDPRLEEY